MLMKRLLIFIMAATFIVSCTKIEKPVNNINKEIFSSVEKAKTEKNT